MHHTAIALLFSTWLFCLAWAAAGNDTTTAPTASASARSAATTAPAEPELAEMSTHMEALGTRKIVTLVLQFPQPNGKPIPLVLVGSCNLVWPEIRHIDVFCPSLPDASRIKFNTRSGPGFTTKGERGFECTLEQAKWIAYDKKNVTCHIEKEEERQILTPRPRVEIERTGFDLEFGEKHKNALKGFVDAITPDWQKAHDQAAARESKLGRKPTKIPINRLAEVMRDYDPSQNQTTVLLQLLEPRPGDTTELSLAMFGRFPGREPTSDTKVQVWGSTLDSLEFRADKDHIKASKGDDYLYVQPKDLATLIAAKVVVCEAQVRAREAKGAHESSTHKVEIKIRDEHKEGLKALLTALTPGQAATTQKKATSPTSPP